MLLGTWRHFSSVYAISAISSGCACPKKEITQEKKNKKIQIKYRCVLVCIASEMGVCWALFVCVCSLEHVVMPIYNTDGISAAVTGLKSNNLLVI